MSPHRFRCRDQASAVRRCSGPRPGLRAVAGARPCGRHRPSSSSRRRARSPPSVPDHAGCDPAAMTDRAVWRHEGGTWMGWGRGRSSSAPRRRPRPGDQAAPSARPATQPVGKTSRRLKPEHRQTRASILGRPKSVDITLRARCHRENLARRRENENGPFRAAGKSAREQLSLPRRTIAVVAVQFLAGCMTGNHG